MRRPRDLDAELQALLEKTKGLKERKVRQLGELVIATGADALDPDALTGGLLALAEVVDPARKESWRKRGQVFFQRRPRNPSRAADGIADSTQAADGRAASAGSEPSAA